MEQNDLAGYIRVSDEKLKTDGDRRQDIERQKEKIIKFAQSMGWGTPIFFSDDGLSAFKEDYNSRPEFCRLLREVRANRISRIIVEDLTRWSRRLEDGIKTLKEVSEKATLTSMAEGECNETTPEGWFKSSLAFLMAEWSSRITAYKVKSGMDRLRHNKEKVCPFCKVVHLGRHPYSCECSNCIQRKGREKRNEKYKESKMTKLDTSKG
jgi:DNA invertase Pin-like site-specific DNA recombinase